MEGGIDGNEIEKGNGDELEWAKEIGVQGARRCVGNLVRDTRVLVEVRAAAATLQAAAQR